MSAIRAAGDAALLLDVTDAGEQEGNGPARIAAAIRAAALPGVVDVVPAAATVLVTIGPGSWQLADLAARLRELASAAPLPLPAADEPDREIPTVYDGPDLDDIAARRQLIKAELPRPVRRRSTHELTGRDIPQLHAGVGQDVAVGV